MGWPQPGRTIVFGEYAASTSVMLTKAPNPCFHILYDYFSLIPSSSLLIILFTFLTSLVVAYNIMSIFSQIINPILISHKIAVVGLAGAGKTTLITALFELIQRGIPVKGIRLHGANTIRAVNQNIACLNSGGSFGPTKEKDTFIFRFSISKGTVGTSPIRC